MKKRLVSLLLVFVLALTLVPSAFATYQDCYIAGCTCTGYCTYGITNYRYESPETHTYSVYCTGCGVGGGVVMAEEHTSATVSVSTAATRMSATMTGRTVNGTAATGMSIARTVATWWTTVSATALPATRIGSITIAVSTGVTPTAVTAARANTNTTGTIRARSMSSTPLPSTVCRLLLHL